MKKISALVPLFLVVCFADCGSSICAKCEDINITADKKRCYETLVGSEGKRMQFNSQQINEKFASAYGASQGVALKVQHKQLDHGRASQLCSIKISENVSYTKGYEQQAINACVKMAMD